jgi:hypothetical protein
MRVAEMRILRWIDKNTRKNRIRNEKILLKIGVTPIDEKMRESCLRWFGHVQRREINAPVRKSELIQVEGTKKCKGIPKITLIEVVKNDMLIKNVTEIWPESCGIWYSP